MAGDGEAADHKLTLAENGKQNSVADPEQSGWRIETFWQRHVIEQHAICPRYGWPADIDDEPG